MEKQITLAKINGLDPWSGTMKILIIDCQDEHLIGSYPVEGKQSAQNIDKRWHDQETSSGHELERIMIRGGTFEIMERNQAIPSGKEVPVSRRI